MKLPKRRRRAAMAADSDDESSSAVSSSSSEAEEAPPPLAPNRARRANAGNRMAAVMAEKERPEEDNVYDDLWGGFNDVRFNHFLIVDLIVLVGGK